MANDNATLDAQLEAEETGCAMADSSELRSLPLLPIPDDAERDQYDHIRFPIATRAGNVAVSLSPDVTCIGDAKSLVEAGIVAPGWIVEGRKSWCVVLNEDGPLVRIGEKGRPKGLYMRIDTYGAPEGEYRVCWSATRQQATAYIEAKSRIAAAPKPISTNKQAVAGYQQQAWRNAVEVRSPVHKYMPPTSYEWYSTAENLLKESRALLNGDKIVSGCHRFRLVKGYRRELLGLLDRAIAMLDCNGKDALVEFADFEQCGGVVYLRDYPPNKASASDR